MGEQRNANRKGKITILTSSEMRRYPFYRILLILVILVMTSMNAPAAERVRFVTIGTGGPKGVYHAVGNAICAMINLEEPRLASKRLGISFRCMAPVTGGSIYNISQLAKRSFDFGLSASPWHYHAYKGTELGMVKPNKNLRAVFSVHSEPMRIVSSKKSGIRRFSDLKGKRVSIGNRGSGTRMTMEILMKTRGMKIGDFKKAAELTTTEEVEALCSNEIDAYITGTGVPNPMDLDVTEVCDAHIVGLNSPIEEKLVSETPYYDFVTIPRSAFKTLNANIKTLGVVATVLTRADVEEITVYETVRAVMDNIDAFRQQHPAFKHLDPNKMIRNGLFAPLHTGALRYYKERGWM